MTIFLAILAFTGPNQANAEKETLFVACLFHAFIKVLWVISIMINLMGHFTGNYTLVKGALSNKAVIMLAKSIPCGMLIQCMIMYSFISSWTNENGYYLTFPGALACGLTFFIATFVVGVLLLIFLEFPYLRLYQMFLLPYLTHDNLLQKWHE